LAGFAARWIATSDKPMAPASVSMWAASEQRERMHDRPDGDFEEHEPDEQHQPDGQLAAVGVRADPWLWPPWP
jgi:hypothetical protein